MLNYNILIIILIFVILVNVYSPYVNKESFANYGNYPVSVEEPLLYGDYKVARNPGISNLSASQIYKNYPVFPSNSLQNNNIRYWRRPTNGKCTPPEMCGNLYVDTKQNIPNELKPLKWNEVPRINYYKGKLH